MMYTEDFSAHMGQVSSVRKVSDYILEEKGSIPGRSAEGVRWVLEALSLR
jgi:hypothetical protein